MEKEMEADIFELLETIGEALEYQMETEDKSLKNDILESRECIERMLNRILPYRISERIHTERLSDADWLLELYRIMEEIQHPFQIQNQYDKAFFDLLNYIWKNKEEQLTEAMKQRLWQFKEQSQSLYNGFVEYFRRFPLWGTIEPEMEDYQTLELRAAVLKEKSYEFLWLYQRFEDYLSKYTLYAILLNWAVLDLNCITKVKSIFPDYYEPDLFPDNKDDVFVDVGAFVGDSILEYIKMYGTEYKRIYAYEISDSSCAELKRNLNGYHDIIVRQKGVGASRGVMYLDEQKDTSANRLGERQNGRKQVEIVSLDEDIDETVTFVKMDIEGAEQSAILGLQKTIERDHPKLAICVYHGYEDIWKIPFMIDSICSGYRFYLRHYGGNLIPTEFVLLGKYR